MINNSKQYAVILVLTVLITACHGGRGKRIISVNENGNSLRIEYSGRITFTDDSTAIKRISRNGYLKYKVNGKKLEAQNRGGTIVYSLYGEDETATLPESDKKFVADAIHDMMKRGHYRN